MNLTTSALAVVITAVFGAGSLTVAVLNAVIGRSGRRADIAEKVSEAWERTSQRLDKDLLRAEEKCEKCEMRLLLTERRLTDTEDDVKRFKAALRALVRVLDSNDPAMIAETIKTAKQMV